MSDFEDFQEKAQRCRRLSGVINRTDPMVKALLELAEQYEATAQALLLPNDARSGARLEPSRP